MTSKYSTKIKPLDDGIAMGMSGANMAIKQVDVFRGQLSGAQVKLRTSKKFRTIIVAVLFLAALVDIMGTVIVAPMMPGLCALADGSPFSQPKLMADYVCTGGAATCAAETQAAYQMVLQSPNITAILSPRAFKSVPLSFSKAMEIPAAIGQVFSGIGSLIVGNVVDKVGAKLPVVVCLSMGLVGYALMYASGMFVEGGSWWLFSIGLWINNLFGVVGDIGGVSCAHFIAHSAQRPPLFSSAHHTHASHSNADLCGTALR
jgi:MFS family permease